MVNPSSFHTQLLLHSFLNCLQDPTAVALPLPHTPIRPFSPSPTPFVRATKRPISARPPFTDVYSNAIRRFIFFPILSSFLSGPSTFLFSFLFCSFIFSVFFLFSLYIFSIILFLSFCCL